MSLKVLFVLFSLGFYLNCSGSYVADLKDLWSAVSVDFDAKIAPASSVYIYLQLNLINIAVDTDNQKLRVAGWITVVWNSGMSWNPKTNTGISVLHVTEGEIWRPELIVENGADDVVLLGNAYTQFLLQYDGNVTWLVPLRADIYCNFQLTYFPFDKQRCGIQVSSWSYSHQETPLHPIGNSINVEQLQSIAEWDVDSSTEVSTSQVNETIFDVTRTQSKISFYFTLTRKTSFYAVRFFVPLVLLSALIMLTFLMPSKRGEKGIYIIVILLVLVLFVSTIYQYCPQSSGLSALVVYMTVVIILAVTAVLCSVIVLYIHNNTGHMLCRTEGITKLLTKITCTHVQLEETVNTEPRPLSEVEMKSFLKDDSDKLSSRKSNGNQDIPKSKFHLAPLHNTVFPTTSDCDQCCDPIKIPTIAPLPDTLRKKSGSHMTWTVLATCLDKLFFVVFVVLTLLVHLVYLLFITINST